MFLAVRPNQPADQHVPSGALAARFSGPDRLVTNEFAHWNPADARALRAADWEMTSGSLFVRDGVAWSGVPDDRTPDARSASGTNSATFRLTTRRKDFGDVDVSVRLRNLGLTSTPSTPSRDWDGVHVWLRYQSENRLYYVSANRRDGTVVVKKKLPGGPTNAGVYHQLGDAAPFPVPYRRWVTLTASARNNADGSVTLRLAADGTTLLSRTDHGLGGAPLTSPGAVGLRGDNCNFEFSQFAAVNHR